MQSYQKPTIQKLQTGLMNKFAGVNSLKLPRENYLLRKLTSIKKLLLL